MQLHGAKGYPGNYRNMKKYYGVIYSATNLANGKKYKGVIEP